VRAASRVPSAHIAARATLTDLGRECEHGSMTRGQLAAVMAGGGVLLVGLTVVLGAVFAATGAYLLIVAPLIGLLVAWEVYRALHRLCSTGSRRAEATAFAGILLLVALAILGVSFGGFPLLLPAILLSLAAALTPRPASPARRP